jgi:predicted small lipoprotein YifL
MVMNQTLVLLMCACCVALVGCGHKGKLKTPSQIEAANAEKAKKAEKAARKQEAEALQEKAP